MKRDELINHLWDGIAILLAIAIVTYMVNRSDQKKKDSIPFRYSIQLSK